MRRETEKCGNIIQKFIKPLNLFVHRVYKVFRATFDVSFESIVFVEFSFPSRTIVITVDTEKKTQNKTKTLGKNY